MDAVTQKIRTEFYLDKFEKNAANDCIRRETFETVGWEIITLWGGDIRKRVDKTMETAVRELQENSRR